MSLLQNFTFFSANFTAEIQSGFRQLSLEEGGGGDKTVYLLELPLQGCEGITAPAALTGAEEVENTHRCCDCC